MTGFARSHLRRAGCLAAAAALALVVCPGCPRQSKLDKPTQTSLKLLGTGTPEEKLAAAQYLGQCRGRELAVVPALIAALDDESPSVRGVATTSLQSLLRRPDLPGNRAAWEKHWRSVAPQFARMKGKTAEHRMKIDRAALENEKGYSYMQIGQDHLAEDFFREAIALDTDNTVYWNNLGKCLWSQGRHPEAVDRFLRAIELAPYFAQAHYNLGEAYLSITETSGHDHTDDALQYASQAIRLDRENEMWEPRWLRARVLLRKAMFQTNSVVRHELYKAAQEAVDGALTINPTLPDVRRTAALIAYGRELYWQCFQEVKLLYDLGYYMPNSFLDKLEAELKRAALEAGKDPPELPRPPGERAGGGTRPPALRPLHEENAP